MRFIHTGDLHIGKTVNDFSMLEDQRFLLKQLVLAAVEHRADAFVIAGDVYDRAVPPAEAVEVLDEFLTQLLEHGIQVLLISGNHDSPQRLGFGEAILKKQGLHMAGSLQQPLRTVTLTDEYGEMDFILMPYVRPALVDADTAGQAVEHMLGTDAVRSAEQKPEQNAATAGQPDALRRRVLATHYFVTDSGREPELSDAETTIHVGGIDNVEAALFRQFDYTALGHIHKPQQIGSGQVWYAGAPLAYTFSECGHTKSVNLVELREKGNMKAERLSLTPLHRMRRIRGSLQELLVCSKEYGPVDDYLQAILTDDGELVDPAGVLRSVYPNLMQIVMERQLRVQSETALPRHTVRRKETTELFRDFYRLVRGEEIDETRWKAVVDTAQKAQGGQI